MARPRKPPRVPGAPSSVPAPTAPQYGWGSLPPRKPGKKRPVVAPGAPGSASDGFPDPTTTLDPGGIRVGGVAPTTPTTFDQWLQGYQPYINAQNATTANRTTQIAQSGKSISDALGMWGGDVSTFQDALKKALSGVNAGQQFLDAIDWNAVTQAAGNANAGGVSVLSKLQQAQDDRQRGLENDLAARGIFRSGERGFGTEQNEEQRGREQFDESQRLNQYLTGLSMAFAQAENQRAADVAGASQQAFDYYQANPVPGMAGMQGAVGAGDPTAPPPPAAATTVPTAASPNPAGRREAYRRRRAAAQAAAARARAQAQGRVV